MIQYYCVVLCELGNTPLYMFMRETCKVTLVFTIYAARKTWILKFDKLLVYTSLATMCKRLFISQRLLVATQHYRKRWICVNILWRESTFSCGYWRVSWAASCLWYTGGVSSECIHIIQVIDIEANILSSNWQN